MNHFYTRDRAERYRKLARLYQLLSIAIMAIGLIVNIGLCTTVRTANAQSVLYKVIAIAVFSGWTGTLLYLEGYKPMLAEQRHIEGILADPESTEELSGTLTVHKDHLFCIPKSITICKAGMVSDGESRALNLDRRFLKEIPEGQRPVRVLAVRGYITGVEVLNEDR